LKFEKFHLSEDLIRNLNNNGFFRTTDIQFKAIPSILKGEDVLAIAQTGTGKTAAFAIPIIELLHQQKFNKTSQGIKCLILVPTRELAEQIGKVFNQLSKHTKVKAFALIGGVEMDPQIIKLEEGVDILIATPGRIHDLILKRLLDLHQVKILTLDEADRMLELGFLHDLKAIKSQITRAHQTLFFSATINSEIKKLAYSQVRNSAIRIQISPDDPVSKNITHFVTHLSMDDKRFFLREYLAQNPDGKFIVFVRTKVRVERVAHALSKLEVQSLTLHGDKDQADRAQTMDAFRAGDGRLLIATDISARGIDIPDVTHVVNYDLPEKPENYVHRIGRTGRGFNKGIAISFCSPEEKPLLVEIENLINKKVEVIKVSSKDYEMIVEPLDLSLDLKELIEKEEAFQNRPRRKKKRK
jgi:ATP-dependent RNA helicase RhlE